MFSTNKPFKFSLLTLAISGLAASQSAFAQSDTEKEVGQPSFTFNKVLVSATRVETSADEVSRSVAVVDKERLETLQPQSVAQAVKYEPNITITGGPRSGNQGVNIRGLEGNKVLQVVDGVRQSFQSGHRPSYFIDPELLKSVEVVKGPASSLWGSGAVGGVVAQNTISASDVLDPDQTLGGFIKSSFNSNNDKRTYLASLAARVDSLDLLVNPYFRESNDLKQGNGEHLENSAKRDHGLLAKAEMQVNEDQALKLIYRQSEEAGGIPSNASASLSTSVFLIDRDTETQSASLEYAINPESDFINTTISVFTDHVEMQESRVSDGRGDSTELDAFGFSVNNQSEVNNIALVYGVDGYVNEFEAERSGTDRPEPPKSESTVWGAYVNAQFGLIENLKVELGARYDSFETEAKNLGTKTDDSDVSPSVALIWQANDAVELTFRHDQAFRAPSAEELYTTGTHFCMGPGFCNTFISNPELKPEKAANTEILARVEFEPNINGGQLFVEGSVFENKVDDFIEQTVEGISFFPVMSAGNTTWRNVDKATLKGFELASTYIQDAFSLKFSYGQTHGQDDKTDAYLSQIPAAKAVIDASQKWLDDSITTGLRVTKTKAQNRVNDGENYEGYALADIYASWAPESVEGLKFDLAVNNLTDRYYRQAWQQLYESGREVIISTKYSF